ncbi:MAG: dephospho-CoA kinase [Lentimicrobiaceae bacterium]|jgi:dephospho-CoA kinase|nr:dephospho-CoA kinase [Lentimicrobiaceae bacterium]MDD4598253.1 dephospho-CoA kinase [Lentimicrobiaceae bacterium]MDY0026883.1 dephospho-CoA kinase [Lentimicrobium sp.]HAH57490.1 dephospho-CoA kinase [Bacteroidales bacterium]
MLKVGLTGSIGSGKSTLARVFSTLGVPVYIADIEAKKILNLPEVVAQVVSLAGEQVRQPDGLIDRKLLAGMVFSNPEMLQSLNGIIHPRVRSHFKAWVLTHSEHDYIIQEAAILFESGSYKNFDKIVVVVAPLEERIERVMLRDGLSREDVMARVDNQLPQEEKIKMADFVILNSDRDQALIQALEIHRQLKALALEFKTIKNNIK